MILLQFNPPASLLFLVIISELLMQMIAVNVLEGHPFTLKCKPLCTCTSTSVFNWYKNGRVLCRNSKSSFHLESVRRTDAGNYSCAVSGKYPFHVATLNVLYPPKSVSVSISPSGEIMEGSSVTLTCSSDANPPAETYTWYKGTTYKGTGQTYNIYRISSEDSGDYICKAENKHGHRSSTAVSLDVLYPPKSVSVSISPSAEIVEGSSVSLTCSSDANPPAEDYFWYKGTSVINRRARSYTIDSISTKDSGDYMCYARNRYGEDYSHRTALNVLYPPKSVSVSISPSGEIMEGSSVTLTCSSDANPPAESYTWYKGTTYKRTGQTYTIYTISSEDSGDYICKAENKHGHRSSTAVSLDVLYPPKSVSVSISPSAEIVEGSSVSLTCSSDANPPVEEYFWYKGTSVINRRARSYTIDSISTKDSGDYMCYAGNRYGGDYSHRTALNVLYPPKSVSVSISPSGEIMEGSSVTLTCSSDANPPVEDYFWYKGTSNIGSGQYYTIDSISTKDSGDYMCYAGNRYGGDYSHRTALNVLYPPKSVSVSISPSGEIMEGSSVTLTCSSDANPPVEEYFWYKGTSVINRRARSYTIDSISTKDSGDYMCYARNRYGGDYSHRTALNVLYPPKSVSVSISPSGEIVEGSSVTLTCSSDANPPAETYTWYKGTIYKGTGQTYTIYTISSEDSGDYICKAENKHGHWSSTAVSLDVLYPPKSVSVSISPSGEIMEGSLVSLTCSSDANPPAKTYTWYKGTNNIGSGQYYTIDSISTKDSEDYMCYARNRYGGDYSHRTALNVLYPPKSVSVSISPSGEILEGSSVTLTCSSDANPPAETYTWYKGTTYKGTGQTYTIYTISSEDSGDYICKAENKHGHRSSTAVSLDVLYPPKSVSVSISPSGEIMEGSLVSLTCSSDANPPAETYTWYKGTIYKGTGQTYNIYTISSEDSGDYICKAENKHGHRSSTAVSLDVLYPPKSVLVSISPSGEIMEGSSVTLNCSSDANPPVMYSWFKGRELKGKGKTYTIDRVGTEDSGNYKCKARNQYKEKYSASVTLNVLYPPKSVSVCISTSGEIEEGSSVNLTCSSDANPPVHDYTWYKMKEKVSSVGHGQSYSFTLSFSSSGWFYCVAQNKYGSQKSSAVPLTLNGSPSWNSIMILCVVVAVAVCISAFIARFFYMRRKMKSKVVKHEYENDVPRVQRYVTLNSRTMSNDVYSTLVASVPYSASATIQGSQ